MSDFLLWVIPARSACLPALIVTLAAPLGLRALSPWPVILALLASTGAAYTLLITAGHETIRSSAWKWIDAGGVDVTLTLQSRFADADNVVVHHASSVCSSRFTRSATWLAVRALSRYFAALSLFVASMTLLVEASDFVVLFLAWELVGLCSYLLIGYYQDRPSAGAAAKKAFIVNRVGDFGFLVGIFWLWTLVGKVAPSVEARLDFDTVFGLADRIAAVRPERIDGRVSVSVPRRRRKVRAVPAPHLASRRDGRPVAGVGAHSCRDDGDCGGLFRRSVDAAARPYAGRAIDYRRHRRNHGAV